MLYILSTITEDDLNKALDKMRNTKAFLGYLIQYCNSNKNANGITELSIPKMRDYIIRQVASQVEVGKDEEIFSQIQDKSHQPLRKGDMVDRINKHMLDVLRQRFNSTEILAFREKSGTDARK